MDAMNWLLKVAQTDSINAIAGKAKLTQSTLNTRAKTNSLTADQVISICRAYGYPPTQGLVDLGFITQAELELPAIRAVLASATEQQLVDEISRRLAKGSRGAFDQPIPPPTSE